MNLHPSQVAAIRDPARFLVLPCGRRTGKTELLKRRTICQAISYSQGPSGRFVLGAPTYQQAKRIFWDDVKALSPPWAVRKISDSELIIWYHNGAYLQVMGLEKPERIEGPPLAGGGCDESGNIKLGAWENHIRPALTDLQGWWWHIGVPEGRNHYYSLYLDAYEDVTGEWGVHHWTTEDVLHLYLGDEQAAREIASAKHDLDELSYQQEYLASFVTYTGLVYYNWDSDLNVDKAIRYSPTRDLHLMLDFNSAPGTMGIAQEYEQAGDIETHIIDEVHISNNSTTPRVVKAFLDKFPDHPGDIYLYGDATGGARGSAKVRGSDWTLVKEELHNVYDYMRVIDRVPKSNPSERISVNSTNARICSIDGTRRLKVHPRAKWTIRDFEGVRVIEGTAGEIDKSDKRITHHSDGVRYYACKRFPIGGATVVSQGY